MAYNTCVRNCNKVGSRSELTIMRFDGFLAKARTGEHWQADDSDCQNLKSTLLTGSAWSTGQLRCSCVPRLNASTTLRYRQSLCAYCNGGQLLPAPLTKNQNYRQLKNTVPLVPLILEGCIFLGIKKSKIVEISELSEFLSTPSNKQGLHATLASIGKQSICYNHDRNKVLKPGFHLGGVPERISFFRMSAYLLHFYLCPRLHHHYG